jgi:hypothetical protein
MAAIIQPLISISLRLLKLDNQRKSLQFDYFGSLLCVFVFLQDAVRVYVRFSSSESAARARKAMDQRWFAGRVVRCEPYDESKFARGEY